MSLAGALFAEGYNPTTQQLLLLAAVVLAGFLFMRMLRRTTPSDGTPRQYRREIESATASNNAIKGDMEHLLIELDRLSREISAQVDTKLSRLEHSIGEADRRIAAMRIMLDAAKSAGASLGIEDPMVSTTDTNGEKSPTAGHETRSARPDSDITADREQIFKLADQGMTPQEIARKIDRRIGEIELILNLRQATGGRGWPSPH